MTAGGSAVYLRATKWAFRLTGSLRAGITIGSAISGGTLAGASTAYNDLWDLHFSGVRQYLFNILVGSALGAGIGQLTASLPLKPEYAGLRSIAEDPKTNRIFTQALQDAASSPRANGYTRLLERLEKGSTVTNEMLDEAWNAVMRRFYQAARRAGLEIAEVHHWNFPRGSHPNEILDPRALYPLETSQMHADVHRATTSQSNIYVGPVSSETAIELPDCSYFLPEGR
jgi:hypothetical protein